MISEATKAKWDKMIETCERYQDELTPWEQTFLISVRKVRDRGFELSYKQSRALRSAYRRIIGKG